MDPDVPHAFFFGSAFTVQEIADKLGICVNQVLGHIEDGTLVAINVGRGAVRRDLRVTDDALDDFARTRTVVPAPSPIPSGKTGHSRKAGQLALMEDGYAQRRAARMAKRKETR